MTRHTESLLLEKFRMKRMTTERPAKPGNYVFDDSTPTLKTLCGEQVLIRPLPPPKQTRGLWIPDTAEQNKPSYEGALNGRVFEGVVVACGPGKVDDSGRLVPIDVVPGDHVRFYFMADYYLRWPDDNHLIVPASFIQAIVSGEQITPLGDRVLVRRMDYQELSRTIIAPDIAKKLSLTGRVLSVGSGSAIPMTVAAGDKVLFNANSGTAVQWHNEDLLILKEGEIELILED